MPILTAIFAGVTALSTLGSGIASGVSNRKSREEAKRLANIQRKDALETEAMSQDLTKRRQSITQTGLHHMADMAKSQTLMDEDAANTMESDYNDSLMEGAGDNLLSSVFGTKQMQNTKRSRFSASKAPSRMFGGQ